MTLVDTIRRVPSVVEKVIGEREELTKAMFEYLGDRVNTIDEIVLVGSGTSNTCSLTSQEFVEKASGLRTQVVLPNPFLSKSVYNPNALYIFTSQSGTSTLTQEAQIKMKNAGYATVALSESHDSPLAKESGTHVLMETDKEEYGCRTIGYCLSAFTQMIIAMEIGRKRGTLSDADYDAYLKQASAAAAHHGQLCDETLTWFDRNKWKLMNKDSFIMYGAGSLYGVAVEGALKALEIAKRYICVGYEMDDGMHGPTMGFTNRHAVVILNNGRNLNIANGLAKYVKNEVSDAFVIGQNTLDDRDLAFDPVGGPFEFLEYAPVLEILAYRLAVDYGVEVLPWGEGGPLPEGKYFNTHDEEE